TEIKELIDNVFESIASGIITTDAADTVTTFNRAAEATLERHRDSAIGERLGTVMVGVSTGFEEALGRVRETGERQMFDAEFPISAEKRIVLNLKLSQLRDGDRKTQGVAMVLEDQTAQREREEMLDIMRRYLPPQLVNNIQEIAAQGLDKGGERRHITCMYVDVRPLNTLPAGMRPTQIMELVNIYLATATDCIHQVSGVIDKYMGQEIMALFNTQLNPMEDHAAQAVEAALLIREAFVQLYAELGINPDPHYYRIGLNTGVATLGNVGSINRRDFTAIGDTINLAKRLEENAKIGQIIISDAARQHLEQTPTAQHTAVQFTEREPLQVKGRQQSTRIYEIARS
ncbi:MAG: PAS domain-containing protein, partial [Armatimonadetes bacterium]|nr:PAS domain-containing protein [Anaerolineae bacterium]